jgi:hypothetical protein
MNTPSIWNPLVTCPEDVLFTSYRGRVPVLPCVHPCANDCGRMTDTAGGRCVDCRERQTANAARGYRVRDDL